MRPLQHRHTAGHNLGVPVLIFSHNLGSQSQCCQCFEVAYGQFLAAGRIFGGPPPKSESGGHEVLGGVRGRSPRENIRVLLQFSGVFMRKSQYLYSCKHEDLMYYISVNEVFMVGNQGVWCRG
jgi:hypothetical protein